MPNNYNFNTLVNLKEIKVNPKGWVNPLIVQYAIDDKTEFPTYYWRVKGTLHTFKILVKRLDFISKGDFKSHFELVLEEFREEYLTWKQEYPQLDWVLEYIKQFDTYILK